MFSSLREEIEAVCEEADRLQAEFERDEWLRAKRSAPAGVDLAEWLASRPKRAAQKPMQQPGQQ
jgi:hypothetical protein